MKLDIGNDAQILLCEEVSELVKILEFLEFYGDKVTVQDVKEILTSRVFELKESLS